ncbi:MAG: OmpA family protein [Flavobacteriales bacterium]|nr:OmpA family protein [Flavobacteriales bacterium]
MIKIILTLAVILCVQLSIGQNLVRNIIFPCDSIQKAGDFDSALDCDQAYKITLMCAPVGPGKVKEIYSYGNSKYYFQEEHNVVWLKFQAIRKSKVAINIQPKSAKDDFDFLLFKYDNEKTKEKIRSKQLKPIRTNIARTKEINDGATGLSYNATRNFVSSGINDSYSKYIEVEKGEVYYLVLDNVYDNGKGATITLDYFRTKQIEGIIVNEEKDFLSSEVIWENITTNEELVKVTSDSITGAFQMTVPYNMNQNNRYVLSAYSEGQLFKEISYTPREINNCEPIPIQMILPELKKGSKTRLSNINFIGNQAIFLESAYPSLKRLLKLMKKNPTLSIHIEGHTNGCSDGVSYSQELSENRANAAKSYLLNAGIDSDRITTEGLNCKFMLYSLKSINQGLNRRIEVLVKDY